MNSTSALPPESGPVLFIDRDLSANEVVERLRSLGAQVELHDDHFSRTESDTKWLVDVGAKGWTILTRDRHILSRPLEIVALVQSNTHVFILKNRKELNGVQMAEALQRPTIR